MIYLDHNATTPISPEVLDAMMPFLTTEWGNPSSGYRFGSKLKQALNTAREQVATLAGCNPDEVLFTSCATEANNAAIRAALAAVPLKKHLITSQIEHSSVLSMCKRMEAAGWSVTYLPVQADGTLSVAALEGAITDQTALVSLMWGNNETGVLFPVVEIAQVCRKRGVAFHCDAVQAAGKIAMDLGELGIDFVTLSAHKLYGPKGCGALIARNDFLEDPLLFGGHQEGGRRGGTENVASIVGFGKAAEMASQNLATRTNRTNQLRTWLECRILAEIPGTWLNGNKADRIPNTANIGFQGVNSDALVAMLDASGICVSSGSACFASSLSPSHVIFAMTGSHEKARQSIRFSLSHLNTEAELDKVAAALKTALPALKQ